jgi:hypothetical protein
MAQRRWLVLIFALLSLGLTGSSAATGFTRSEHAMDVPAFTSVHGDGLVPIAPATGALTAIIRNHRQPFFKLLAGFVLVFVVVVASARGATRRRPPRPVTETPGPSIRRRGPPAACFSASI